MPHKYTPEERIAKFHQRLDKSSDPNGCWVWIAGHQTDGYGTVGWGDKRTMLAHRVAWELVNGPIPDGMSVLHRCDNRPCCNPSHLFLGTQADNMADCSRKNRTCRGERGGNHRLTQMQVDEIRLLYLLGSHNQRMLSDLFGIDPSTISHVVRGLTWSDSFPAGDQ